MAWSSLGITFILLLMVQYCFGFTNPEDVYAINNLYVALGSPPLPGWIPNGGDPCLEAWQGVQCENTNIIAITINAANLGGELGDTLGNFTSIITIDLSNNNIAGSIPENLPTSLRTFFLSANQLTGSIPSSLSLLTELTAMSVNENHLTGDLPDAFQLLVGVVNLDLSSNNFSGPLPPSMGNLSTLTTLRVQNNQLSGTLDVLRTLPLRDLNVENNLFAGPVPEELLSIPNFKKDGNPFNTSISPASPSLIPSTSPPGPPPFSSSKSPPPKSTPSNFSSGPSAQTSPKGKKHNTSAIKVIGYVLVAVVSLIIIVLAVVFCISKYQERESQREEITKWQPAVPLERPKEPRNNDNSVRPNTKKVQNASDEQMSQHEIDMTRTAAIEESKKQDREIDMTDEFLLPPPPPPIPVEKVIVNPIIPPEPARTAPMIPVNTPTSVASYSIASLQQYTNSFSDGNLIKDGRLGKVYLAELPDGKLLAVMKLDNASSKISDDDFLELVVSISELRHPNIVELVGYCAEFGQRLLVYNYFSKLTLHDMLHYEDDLKSKLTWDARLQIALGAAKALEYLHEFCQPPIVHQDFEPSNIFLNGELAVRVSECGLAPLLSSNSVTQLSGRMRALFNYEAPEYNESGVYTEHSDVYSFGVVMLELLTGRMPYDSSRPRAEQHLVRWASSQLHDINNLSKMVDPSIFGNCPKKSLSQFADIISRCIQHGPEFRPPMSEVVQDLARMIEDAKKETSDTTIKSRRKREVG